MSKPFFIKDPLNLAINIARVSKFYVYYLPAVSTDTSSAIINLNYENPSLKVNYDQQNLNTSLIFDFTDRKI